MSFSIPRVTALRAAAIAGLVLMAATAPVLSETIDPPSNGTEVLPLPRLRPGLPAVAPAPLSQIEIESLVTQPMDEWSSYESQAAAFANSITGRALGVIDDTRLVATERLTAFRHLVAELFDVKTMGRILLGPNREKLSERQLASYQSIVADYLVPIYATRLGQVCNTQPSIVAVQERNGSVFVRTEFTTEMGAPPTFVDWVVAQQPDGTWRALDISINGVSLAQSKREEFTSVIDNRGADAFLELLHAQAGDVMPEPMSVAMMPPSVPVLASSEPSPVGIR